MRAPSLLLVLLGVWACGDDSSASDVGPVDANVDAAVDVGPVSFSVATWNVENLFDALDDPEKMDERPSSAQVADKLDAVARVLMALDADLVALQEVENENILDMLADGPAASLGYDQRFIFEGFDPRGIDVACLARIPVAGAASHIGEDFPNEDGSETYFFTRDALEIFAEPGGIPVTVMVLHFISMSDGGTDDRRHAEGLQARRIADARVAMGMERYLIAGDFNDFPSSDPVTAITGGPEFTDLTVNVPLEERYTFVFRGIEQQVDYIIGTPIMQAEVDEVAILHGPEVDAASDHSPIVARFTLNR